MNNDIYTMEQWKADGEFKAAPGQEIEEQIYDKMLNATEPSRLSEEAFLFALANYWEILDAGFMMGEPAGADSGGLLYEAFGMTGYSGMYKKEEIHYYYLGMFHLEKELEGTYYCFYSAFPQYDGRMLPANVYKNDEKAIADAIDREATVYKYEIKKGVKVRGIALYDPEDFPALSDF